MLKLFATIITALIVSGCAYTTETEVKPSSYGTN